MYINFIISTIITVDDLVSCVVGITHYAGIP